MKRKEREKAEAVNESKKWKTRRKEGRVERIREKEGRMIKRKEGRKEVRMIIRKED